MRDHFCCGARVSYWPIVLRNSKNDLRRFFREKSNQATIANFNPRASNGLTPLRRSVAQPRDVDASRQTALASPEQGDRRRDAKFCGSSANLTQEGAPNERD